MRPIPLLLFAILVCPSYAQTLMSIGHEPHSPIQILSTMHSIPDALSAAVVENKSGKTITAYRIGWASIRAGKTVWHQGTPMNLPAGVPTGSNIAVPAQNIAIEEHAASMVFFVSEVTFADGSHWKAGKQKL